MDTDVAVTLRPHPVSCNQFFVIVFVHCIFLSVITKVKAKRIHIKKSYGRRRSLPLWFVSAEKLVLVAKSSSMMPYQEKVNLRTSRSTPPVTTVRSGRAKEVAKVSKQ